MALFACKKNSIDESAPPTPLPDYAQLKVGNYWVYDFYKVDTNGLETKLTDTDSSYILKDTLIDGVLYFVKLSSPYQLNKSAITGNFSDTTIVRDSSGCLLMRYYNGTTRILFARDNYSEALYIDTIRNIYYPYHVPDLFSP